MVQSLQLGRPSQHADPHTMQRLNRLPIFAVITLVLIFLAVIIYGLSSRGLYFTGASGPEAASSTPASNFAEQLKKGVTDGIISEPAQAETFKPTPLVASSPATQAQSEPEQEVSRDVVRIEPETEWLARLERERKEQSLRERHRQEMARLQAQGAAYDSPLLVDITKVGATNQLSPPSETPNSARVRATGELYAEALRAGLAAQEGGANLQALKQDFFNQDIKDLGYLPNQVVSPLSNFELKRGSVIPATLISGINSDLPGRISAQVSRNVYDSATGHRLLIPQGAKLFGRYSSDVSFGQSRLLVIWTDVIFPNGSTLQIGGMAGTDAEGYGGYADRVDRHYLRTFASAALVAIIGAGMDMSLPDSSGRDDRNRASDAARRSFAETFGRLAERTVGKNLDVQPTLRIRPGYQFNVLVDQDIVFPGPYRDQPEIKATDR
ncbi:UNVERIFIED_ORG: type IV secretion system protein VirB10 [Ensifer adhaerens]|nr:type IV secretion system protein VirB10 [Ensifer adhaerens]